MITGDEIRSFSDPTPIDNITFGHYIDLEGNFLVVTESYDVDDEGHFQLIPRVYVFNTQTGDLINTIVVPDESGYSSPSWSSWSISLDGGLVVVSGLQQWRYFEPFVPQSNAYVFDVTTGQMLYSLQSPPLSGGFGWDADIDENIIVVGDRYFYGGQIYV